MHRVAVVGGGFAGVYAIKELHKKNDVDITLFEPRDKFVFTPLLHEVAAGVLHVPSITHSYSNIFHGHFKHVKKAVEAVHLSEKKVVSGGEVYEFDYVIIATGAKTWLPKPLDVFELKSDMDALKIKDAVANNLVAYEKSQDPRLLHTVVVGGGPTGIELACELASCYKWMRDCNKLHAVSQVTIVQSKELLKGVDTPLRKKVEKSLERKGIDVVYARVENVSGGKVVLPDRTLEAGLVVWTAGVVPEAPSIDVPLTKGHVPRNDFLQIPAFDFAYAVGDVAAAEKFAQRAVQEGAFAAKNILLQMKGRKVRRFNYKSKGFLMSLGQKDGVGETFGVLFGGFFAWFVWRTVYLSKFVGVRSKLRMASEYTIRLFKRE